MHVQHTSWWKQLLNFYHPTRETPGDCICKIGLQLFFANVLARYVASNIISSLNLNQRRLVAATVFQALDKVKPKNNKLPTFDGLRVEELACAKALLEYNVDLDSGTKQPELVDGDEFAITITPAIAILLYSMAGVDTTLMNGWRSEKELAALYGVRSLMLKCVETFAP